MLLSIFLYGQSTPESGVHLSGLIYCLKIIMANTIPNTSHKEHIPVCGYVLSLTPIKFVSRNVKKCDLWCIRFITTLGYGISCQYCEHWEQPSELTPLTQSPLLWWGSSGIWIYPSWWVEITFIQHQWEDHPGCNRSVMSLWTNILSIDIEWLLFICLCFLDWWGWATLPEFDWRSFPRHSAR